MQINMFFVVKNRWDTVYFIDNPRICAYYRRQRNNKILKIGKCFIFNKIKFSFFFIIL